MLIVYFTLLKYATNLYTYFLQVFVNTQNIPVTGLSKITEHSCALPSSQQNVPFLIKYLKIKL